MAAITGGIGSMVNRYNPLKEGSQNYNSDLQGQIEMLNETGMLSRAERFCNFHIFIPMFPVEYMLYKLTTDHNYNTRSFRKILTKIEYTKYIDSLLLNFDLNV